MLLLCCAIIKICMRSSGSLAIASRISWYLNGFIVTVRRREGKQLARLSLQPKWARAPPCRILVAPPHLIETTQLQLHVLSRPLSSTSPSPAQLLLLQHNTTRHNTTTSHHINLNCLPIPHERTSEAPSKVSCHQHPFQSHCASHSDCRITLVATTSASVQ